MTTFDKREEGFEKKFAHDEELRFKATARRNKLLGLWVAQKLGISATRPMLMPRKLFWPISRNPATMTFSAKCARTSMPRASGHRPGDPRDDRAHGQAVSRSKPESRVIDGAAAA